MVVSRVMEMQILRLSGMLLLMFLQGTWGASRVLFYPTVLDTCPNLLEGMAWNDDRREWGVYEKASGTLLAEDEPMLRLASKKSVSAYWQSSIHIQTGHQYLAGAWVRYNNAKILFWNYGTDATNGNMVERRLYCFGGFNTFLTPYFSPESRKILLGGDPNKWHLCYRTMDFPTPLKHNNIIAVNIGLYMATGELDIIHPFIVDITDTKDVSLCIDIADAPVPVRKLSVEHAGIRDVIWEKSFNPPVSTFKTALTGVTDFNRNQDKNTILGYTLLVEHADGSCQTISAPKDNIFRERE